MRKELFVLILFCISIESYAQNYITGNVVDEAGKGIEGVNVKWKDRERRAISDRDGNFRIDNLGDTLTFSSIGFDTMRVSKPFDNPFIVVLKTGDNILKLVEISTGYYTAPQERFTGSFVHIDNDLLNRSSGEDILNRLEGVTNGLQFDKRRVGSPASMGENYSNIRIRGESSINSSAKPLIVVDNFPYEGEIIDIDPNDVESVTVLRDAAAASIWGAKAGNGVIIITTKKGRFDKPAKIGFATSFTLGELPDLFYNKRFLSSKDFIEMERFYFDQGYYTVNDWTPLTPVVEALIKNKADDLSDQALTDLINTFEKTDIRNEAQDYLYRSSFLQQYSLNINGGSSSVNYFVSGTYSKNAASLVGNQNERISMRSNTLYKPINNLEVSVGFNYSHSGNQNNGMSLEDLATEGKRNIYPYATLQDGETNLSLVRKYRQTYVDAAESNGLLNWQFRPLEEREEIQNTEGTKYIDLNTTISYKILKDLNIQAFYQYQLFGSTGRVHYSKESFYARDFVNRYTQADGTKPFPEGGILRINQNDRFSHSGRVQMNYSGNFKNDFRLHSLAGMELRQVKAIGNQNGFYGYDDEFLTFTTDLDYTKRFPTRPRQTAKIPFPQTSLADLTDRYLSYYSNSSLFFKERYGVTGSIRWDASNLFGVKTRQKGVPLWSLGSSWTISNEPFWNVEKLNLLKLRMSYGYNGNTNRTVSGLITAIYTTDYLTDLNVGILRSPGNPQLRWERIGIWNIGLDFSMFNNRISGSFESFVKKGKDLLGEIPMAPSTGVDPYEMSNYKVNYADMRTKGMDIRLTTNNLNGKLKWNTSILFSYSSNKITNYKGDPEVNLASTYFSAYGAPPIEGRSIDGFFSYPWIGLDPETGDPLVLFEDKVGTDYANYTRSMNHENLLYSGVSVAPYFGNIINTFSWKNVELSANISWKAGYYFRRNSINYTDMVDSWQGHEDINLRWRAPGDEKFTNVPSMPIIKNTYRDQFYNNSEVLVEKGDHIRLHDLNISYSFNQLLGKKDENLKVFFYARELGILWRANKFKLDPDQSYLNYPPIKTFSIGVNMEF